MYVVSGPLCQIQSLWASCKWTGPLALTFAVTSAPFLLVIHPWFSAGPLSAEQFRSDASGGRWGVAVCDALHIARALDESESNFPDLAVKSGTSWAEFCEGGLQGWVPLFCLTGKTEGFGHVICLKIGTPPQNGKGFFLTSLALRRKSERSLAQGP